MLFKDLKEAAKDPILGLSEEFNNDSNPNKVNFCLLYTSPSPRDRQKSRMPSSA